MLQLLVVSTPSPDATDGTLQRYERTSPTATWTPVGKPIAVSVGAAGLKTDKREGDRASPAGLFALGPVVVTGNPKDLRAPYVRAHEGSVCVDDPQSAAYGLITGIDAFPKAATWQSAENMQMYRRAVVVEYNRPARAGRGSCIFLHAWSYPGEPTLGCTAMSAEHLRSVSAWLDPARTPFLLQGVAPSPGSLLASLPPTR